MRLKNRRGVYLCLCQEQNIFGDDGRQLCGLLGCFGRRRLVIVDVRGGLIGRAGNHGGSISSTRGGSVDIHSDGGIRRVQIHHALEDHHDRLTPYPILLRHEAELVCMALDLLAELAARERIFETSEFQKEDWISESNLLEKVGVLEEVSVLCTPD